MKDDFTLKDLVVDFDASNFASAFGLKSERAKEIHDIFKGIIREFSQKQSWSASEILKIAADRNVVSGFKEVAFIIYLLGFRVGEDTLAQVVLGTVEEKALSMPLKSIKRKKYVN